MLHEKTYPGMEDIRKFSQGAFLILLACAVSLWSPPHTSRRFPEQTYLPKIVSPTTDLWHKIQPPKKTASSPTTPSIQTSKIILEKGATLSRTLEKNGFRPEETHAITQAITPLINPRSLKAGQEIQVYHRSKGLSQATLESLSFFPEMGTEIKVTLTKEGIFQAQKKSHQLSKRQVAIEGTIQTSLYHDAFKKGASVKVLQQLIRALGAKFDFQRDFQSGDTFKIFYEETWDPKRDEGRPEALLFATLTVDKKPHQIYQFKRPGSTVPEFFDEKGEAFHRALLRTPVDGARLSSPFGRRRHPVLGYTKMHKGIDFAAPTGTPIMAAGDGTVLRASPYGSYGKYVLIRHCEGYQTAYAHMSRFAVHAGQKIRQGEIIGYIGTTGRSTGPHLHFELLKDGKHINPKAVKQLPSLILKGASMKAFQSYKQQMNRAYLTQIGS